MKVIKYEKFLENKLAGIRLGDKCPICNGAGYTDTMCDCCGHESEEGCFCDDGEVDNVDNYDENDIKSAFPESEYNKAVIADLVKLVGMYPANQGVIDAFFEHSKYLNVRSDIKEKSLLY